MTRMVKLVSVMERRIETFQKVLDEILQEGDPNDPKTAKRARILRAATELFIRYGYRKTNIEDIAKRAGMAKGTVYLYYKSKPEILAHAVAAEKKQYMGVIREILAPDKHPVERLREWLLQLFVLGSKMPLTSRVLSGDPETLAAIFEFMDHYKEQELAKLQLDFVCALLAEAGGVESPEEIAEKARVLLGLAFLAGRISDEKIRGGLSVERFASLLSGMLTDGLAAPAKRSPRREKKEV